MLHEHFLRAIFRWNVRRRLRARPPKVRWVSWDDVALTLCYKPRVVCQRVEFANVQQVIAWKEDLFGQDCINLGFRSAAGLVSVGEDVEGFERVIGELLPERFAGLYEHWYVVVRDPAFERNLTLVWGERTFPDDPVSQENQKQYPRQR